MFKARQGPSHLFLLISWYAFNQTYHALGQRLQDVTVKYTYTPTPFLRVPASYLQPHVWLPLAGSHFDITPHAFQQRWGDVPPACLHPNNLQPSVKAWLLGTFCCVETYIKHTQRNTMHSSPLKFKSPWLFLFRQILSIVDYNQVSTIVLILSEI